MPVSSILLKNFEWYQQHQDELVQKYNGQFLVIVDCTIQGAFATEEEGYAFASGRYDPGTFMLHLCGPGAENYTVTFYSPWVGAA